MRVQRFDGHSKEVRTAGRRASHVDQRKTAAEKYAGKKRSEHRIAVIGRRERKDEIQKKGIDQNRADGFDHKFTPDNPVTEQNQGMLMTREVVPIDRFHRWFKSGRRRGTASAKLASFAKV